MDGVEFFKSNTKMIIEEDLIRLDELKDDELLELGIYRNELKKVVELLDVDFSFLFYDPNEGLQRFCYWDKKYYYQFIDLSMRYFQLSSGQVDGFLLKDFLEQKNVAEELFENEDWEAFFYYMDVKASLLSFQHLRKKVPKDLQKKIFLYLYIENEYGFDRLDQEMVREVLELPTPEDFNIKKQGKKPNKDRYYNIYRGESTESTPLDKAYSWSLKKETAISFATRHQSKWRIIIGEVHEDDVKAYSNVRNESEVLVFPEDVKVVRIVNN